MRKRLLACLLALALCLTLLPSAAFAAVSVSYIDADGKTQTCTSAIEVTANDNATGWSNNWYVVNSTGPATIEGRVTVTGVVHLILADGCNLTVNGGIQVQDDDNNPDTPSPNSLTIYGQSGGTGSLTATATEVKDAGIGGGNKGAGGKITISGGTVIATGSSGAGIGGGSSGGGGEINISGGTVTATSSRGAGIGGGNGGTINISSGTVNATSSSYGAGIGGGGSGGGGEINISGGTVIATSSDSDGAGIGGGSGGGGGKITISGGTVNATSSNGAGIGGGGRGGAFKTETNGNAFIVASSISDQTSKGTWRGVIFEGNDGQVYGEQTLTKDTEITSDQTLTIPADNTLTINSGVTLTNNGGTITNNGGTITNYGTIINDGTINGTVDGNPAHVHVYAIDWSSDATHHWHDCTGCPLSKKDGYAAHTPGDWIVDQAATSTTAGSRHKVCTVCGYTTQTETIPATGGGDSGGGNPGGGDSGSGDPGGGDSGSGDPGGDYIPPYIPPTYPPKVEKPSEGGGTPSVTPSRPEQGDTVTWAAAQDIVGGGNGLFAPNDPITREQLAVMLWRYSGSPPATVKQLHFNDTDEIASFALEAMRWAVEQGILGGYGNGRLDPQGQATRAQVAQMLKDFIENQEDKIDT